MSLRRVLLPREGFTTDAVFKFVEKTALTRSPSRPPYPLRKKGGEPVHPPTRNLLTHQEALLPRSRQVAQCLLLQRRDELDIRQVRLVQGDRPRRRLARRSAAGCFTFGVNVLAYCWTARVDRLVMAAFGNVLAALAVMSLLYQARLRVKNRKLMENSRGRQVGEGLERFYNDKGGRGGEYGSGNKFSLGPRVNNFLLGV